MHKGCIKHNPKNYKAYKLCIKHNPKSLQKQHGYKTHYILEKKSSIYKIYQSFKTIHEL